MTPAARVAAAIEVMDAVLTGTPADRALTSWGRAHRFAGSKDRAAIRDHVFQALRCKWSYGWLGGADTGRGILLGAMRAAGQEHAIFTGEGHAPAPVAEDEASRPLDAASRSVRLDMPDWLMAHFDTAFADHADDVMAVLRDRAGVFLRVNTARATWAEAVDLLASDGIVVRPVDGVKTALDVIENERKISQSKAYLDGVVEVQDPSSQQVTLSLGLGPSDRVLDYCAGGGGKALAMAATGAQVVAHDVDPRRMTDIAPRAKRAGVTIETVGTEDLPAQAPFDLVFCDAPCSGSGTWRRTPQAKWALTPERLQTLTEMQFDALSASARHVRKGGRLVYATCSVFAAENAEIVGKFLKSRPDFRCETSVLLTPDAQQDGFFFALFDHVI